MKNSPDFSEQVTGEVIHNIKVVLGQAPAHVMSSAGALVSVFRLD
jgi:hypothetical protein